MTSIDDKLKRKHSFVGYRKIDEFGFSDKNQRIAALCLIVSSGFCTYTTLV